MHARGEVTREEYEGNSVQLAGRAPADLAGRIARRAIT
jgi:hypothetical protein